MALGIDRQVQDRADKYRQNPAALQKNYQMNNDLLDLLALQSLKSDTDKAKAKIAASMGQNPKTIAEQRGEEAITRTKDDLVEQVGGIAAQQQNTQKQNMQRAAAGAPPSAPPGPPGARPPGPPQQMAGVAGQSAPNMARMAGGGIVSFAGEGDSLVKVTDEQLRAMGITPSAWAGMNERDKALAIRSRLQGDKSLPPVTSELRARKGSMRPGLDAVGQSAADRDLISGEVIRSPADREARGLAAMEAREAERRKGMSAGQLAATPGFQPPNTPPGLPPVARIDPMMVGPAGDMAHAQLPPPQPQPRPTAPSTALPTAPPTASPTGIAAAAPPSDYLTNYKAARTDNAAFLGRAEDKASREAMLAKTKALNLRLKQEEKDNSFYSSIAGIRDFRDVGTNVKNQRRQSALDEERRLGREQEIEGAQLKAYFDIGSAAITGAGKTATGIGAEKQAKVTAKLKAERSALLSRQIDSTDRNAVRKFQGDMLALKVKTASSDAKNIELAISNAQLLGRIPPEDPGKTAAIKDIRDAAERAIKIRDADIEVQAKRILSGGLRVKKVSQ